MIVPVEAHGPCHRLDVGFASLSVEERARRTQVRMGFLIEAVEGGAAISEIREGIGIKPEEMLSHMLNTLVTKDILEYSDGVYRINEITDPLDEKQYQWLEEHYPASMEITLLMYDHSADVLKTGEPVEETGFKGEFLDLWDEVMSEFPYSFKKMMLNKTFADLEDGDIFTIYI